MNPLLQLASSLAAGTLDEPAAAEEVRRLGESGRLSAQLLREALGTALAGDAAPSPAIVRQTVLMVSRIWQGLGAPEEAARTVLEAMRLLDKRPERCDYCDLFEEFDRQVSALVGGYHPLTKSAKGIVISVSSSGATGSLGGTANAPYEGGAFDEPERRKAEELQQPEHAHGGVDSVTDLRCAANSAALARRCSVPVSREFLLALRDEATARCRLAELGEEQEINFRLAAALWNQFWHHSPAGSEQCRIAQTNERIVRLRLADLGVEAVANYQHVAQLCQLERKRLSPGSKHFGLSLYYEGRAASGLAELEVESKINFRQSATLWRQSRENVPVDDVEHRSALLNEAISLDRLRKMGGTSPSDDQQITRLCRKVREYFASGSDDFRQALSLEAGALIGLAEQGLEPVTNFQRAAELFQQVRHCCAPRSEAYRISLSNETMTCRRLAERGVQPVINWRRVAELSLQEQECCHPASEDLGNALLNEGLAYARLAELKVEPLTNLWRANERFDQASRCFLPEAEMFGIALVNEGAVYGKLPALGYEPEASFRRAAEIYQQARACLSTDSEIHRIALAGEGWAFLCLGNLGVVPEAHYRLAASLFHQACECRGDASEDQLSAAINWGRSLHRLAGVVGREEVLTLLVKAHSVLREEAVPLLEQLATAETIEDSRRALRDRHADAFKLLLAVCLGLSEQAESAPGAESLRWEAWHWVQRSKARTLEEGLRGLGQGRLAEEHTAEFEERLAGLASRDWPDDAEEVARLRRLIPSATGMVGAGTRPEDRDWLAAAGAVAGRGAVVVEFFTRDDGRVGAFVQPADRTAGLRPPVWLDYREAGLHELSRRCLAATKMLAQDPGRRSRAGTRKGSTEQLAEEAAKRQAAMEDLAAVCAELGAALRPLREELRRHGWQEAPLVLCPTSALHLLPLAAAVWEDSNRERPHRWIDAQVLVQLPTAGLAAQMPPLPVPAEPAAYVVAADPHGTLSAHLGEVAQVGEVLAAAGFRRIEELPTVAGFRRAAAGAWLVHLAMHTRLHPRFELCGLGFADRRLTVLELLARVRLDQTAVAVVATCASGQAQHLEADDPSMLARAWLLAGCRCLVASLWPLDDQAAADFSRHLYAHWRHRPLAAAFRLALRELRRSRPHDDLFAWAPFNLIGKADFSLRSHPRAGEIYSSAP